MGIAKSDDFANFNQAMTKLLQAPRKVLCVKAIPRSEVAFLFALLFFACLSSSAFAQQCPETSTTGPSIASEIRTFEGTLIFHDGLRRWFELKLDQPQCGENSIQLVRGARDWTPLEILRDCRVQSKGALAISGTGYYSLDIYQFVDQVEPLGACELKAPFCS